MEADVAGTAEAAAGAGEDPNPEKGAGDCLAGPGADELNPPKFRGVEGAACF